MVVCTSQLVLYISVADKNRHKSYFHFILFYFALTDSTPQKKTFLGSYKVIL